MQFELLRTQSGVASLKTYQATIEDEEITDMEILSLAALDPATRQIADQYTMKKMELASIDQLSVPGSGQKSKFLRKYYSEMESVKQQYDEMSKNLQQQIRDKKRVDTNREITRMESEVAILKEQEKQFRATWNASRRKLKAWGRSGSTSKWRGPRSRI